MKRLRSTILRILLLVGLGWIAYANLSMFGSAGDMVHKMVRTVRMKVEMRQIATACRAECLKTKRIPGNPAKTYRAALHKKGKTIGKDTGKDPWGRWYRARASKIGFYLVSAGSDRTFGTKDDILLNQSLKNRDF